MKGMDGLRVTVIINKIRQMSNKEGIKIKEFEWYEVETKVREIMVDLLQPFNKKQTEETIKLNQAKRILAALQKKIEDHDFLLDREGASKPSYLQQQDAKIDAMAAAAHQAQLQNEARIKRMEAVVQIYEEKIKQLNDLESRVDKEVLERAQEARLYKTGLDRELELMTKKQDAQTEEVNQFKNLTKAAMTKMEGRMIGFDNRLRELEDDSRHKGSDIRKLLEEVSAHNQKIIKLELKTVNLASRVQDRQRDSKLSQKFLGKVKEVENDLRFLTTFLEQYQPLYTQLHISETLNSFISGRQRRKLCIYQQQRFARLHHHILMNQRNSLEDLMSAYTNNIRKIINRNKKYIINLAVADSVKYGTNVYEFRLDDPNDHQEENENKQSQQMALPEEEITRIVNDRLTGMSNQIRLLLEEEVKPTRTWMKELQEQLLMRSLEYDQKHEDLRKQITENQAKCALEEKHVSTAVGELRTRQTQLEGTVSFFREYVKDILNFSSVINHIVIQDQIDRQGTALYALRGNKNAQITQMPTLQLDPNCISCENKNAPMVQQAFKMACLTYNPSQIRIDDQLFSRQEILEISTGILEKLKKKLWNTEAMRSTTLNNPPTLGTIDREQPGKKTFEGKTPRKSSSVLKEGSLTSRESGRSKELQTLLPILGATSKGQRRERKTQLSVFY